MTLIVGCDGDGNGGSDSEARALVEIAGYATFATAGGCLDEINHVDCNLYANAKDVYVSAGPIEGGLPDGEYFFVVLEPGYQYEGFRDGAPGNLSDDVANTIDDAGGTDEGTGHGVEKRTFTVVNHEIVEPGSHATSRNSMGKTIVQVGPFDTSDHPGGAYVLGICRADAIAASECEFDAFRIQQPTATAPVEQGTLGGGKYYDANTNGMRDAGEPGLSGWWIDYSNGEVLRIATDSEGRFRVELATDAYAVAEVVPLLSPSWRQTGNRGNQTSSDGGSSVTLDWDMSYDAVVVDLGESEELWFGNVCLGGGGGHTLGFWGAEKAVDRVTSSDLELLATLNLVDGDGEAFDPVDHPELAAWLRAGSAATNMAHQLSVQLAAMQLNTTHIVDSSTPVADPDSLVYAPGVRAANVSGFAKLGDLMIEADTALSANPVTEDASSQRSHQEALKVALAAANEDRSFAQATPDRCPVPLFAAPGIGTGL